MVFVLSSRPVMSRFRRGVRREQNLVASLLAGANARYHSRSSCWFRHGGSLQRPRCHRADTCARSSRQVSARFRRTAGRTHHFPPAPLHFTSISAVASAARTYISVPFVPTAANCRDRQRQRCAQGCQRPRCSAYRPRPAIWPRDFVRPRHRHYGARLRLSPRTRQ